MDIDSGARVNNHLAKSQYFDSGKTALSIDLMNYLRDWLTGHIKQEDKAYGPYLGKGAKVGV